MNIKEDWIKELREADIKYFVLKVEDFLNSLTEEECLEFDEFLVKHEEYRSNNGKSPFNEYYVVNRDDVPNIKSREEFLKIIGYKK